MFKLIAIGAMLAVACGGAQRRPSLPCGESIAARARGDDAPIADGDTVRQHRRDLYYQGCFEACKQPSDRACLEMSIIRADLGQWDSARAVGQACQDPALGADTHKAACAWTERNRKVYDNAMRNLADGEETTARETAELSARYRESHGTDVPGPAPRVSIQSLIDQVLAIADSDTGGEGYHVVRTEDYRSSGDAVSFDYEASPLNVHQIICVAATDTPFHATVTSGNSQPIEFSGVATKVAGALVERVAFNGDINHAKVHVSVQPQWHNTPHAVKCRIYTR